MPRRKRNGADKDLRAAQLALALFGLHWEVIDHLHIAMRRAINLLNDRPADYEPPHMATMSGAVGDQPFSGGKTSMQCCLHGHCDVKQPLVAKGAADNCRGSECGKWIPESIAIATIARPSVAITAMAMPITAADIRLVAVRVAESMLAKVALVDVSVADQIDV